MGRLISSAALVGLLGLGGAAAAQGIDFGIDDGEWARDGECDDRRFAGPGMAIGLTWAYVGFDATDCRAAFDAGQISLWVPGDAKAATQCAAIDFGNDSGEYPQDDECDDMRFEGQGVAAFLDPENMGKDASDCARLCAYGVLALRDY